MRLVRNFSVGLLLLILFVTCTKPTEKAANFRNITDFNGQTVAVCVGSTHDRYLRQHYPAVNLFRVDEATYGILPVLKGQVAAAVLGGGLAKIIVNEQPDLAMLAEPIFQEPIAIGLKDKSLQNDFNLFLAKLEASDTLAAIIKRWSQDDGTATIPHIDNDGCNGKLHIGMTMVMPYSFVRNGNFCGIDLELLFRFAAAKKLEPDVRILNFSSILAALETDRVDAICGGLAITDERRSKARFSNSYLNSAAVIVVLKKNAAPAAIAPLDSAATNNNSHSSWWVKVKKSFYNNLIKEKRYLLIFNGMATTLNITLLSIIFGTLLGCGVCFLRMNRLRSLQTAAKIYIALLRGIPQVVLLMLMFYVVFASSQLSGVTIATITFSLYFAAYVAAMLRVAIESIDKGQTEAGIVLGFTKVKTFCYIVFPQALKRILPIYKNDIISLVKMTSIVGYIAVQDLTKAGDIIRSRTFEAFFPLIFVAVLYFLLAWILISLLTIIEKKYGTHHKN